ncbi:hypothetical protein ACWCQX_46340, partial [Streptomyces sp. NPDC002346]
RTPAASRDDAASTPTPPLMVTTATLGGRSGRIGVSYIEVRPARGTYEVYVHTVEDVGHESFFDLVQLTKRPRDQLQSTSVDRGLVSGG